MTSEMIESHAFDEIQLGQSAEVQRTLTRDDVALFSTVSGDVNPTHVNDQFAKQSGYHGITGHSMWGGSLISGLLGTVLPGPGSVYRSQDFCFYDTIALGDTLTARVKVREKKPDDQGVVLDCEVTNQDRVLILKGTAEVQAPKEKVSVPRTQLPEVRVRHHDSYAELFKFCAGLDPVRTAVVHPCERTALSGAVDAAKQGLITPTLIGPRRKIEQVAETAEIDLTDLVIVDVPHSHAAAAEGVERVRKGNAEILMKGSLHTDELMKAVLSSTTGIRSERRVSHVFVMDVPTYPKVLLVTDAAINIAPNLETKKDICQNAIDLTHTLEIEQPKVAILSAVETINPGIPSTLEAAALCKMADRGQITGGLLDGPLAMDNAINKAAAKTKQIDSLVAGDADILLAPDLEAGNILAKQLTFLANADAAGIVLGARVPVILTSRADNVRTRLASCAVAVAHAHTVSGC